MTRVTVAALQLAFTDDVEQNIAVCYGRSGQLPRAIFHFERALLLRPGDEGVEQGLAAAEDALARARAEEEGEAEVAERVRVVRGYDSVDELQVAERLGRGEQLLGEVAGGFLLEHAQDVDGLLRHGKVLFRFAGNRVFNDAQMNQSRGVQGGGPNSPSERGSSAAIGGGDAAAGAALVASNLTRFGADGSARAIAILECKKLLLDTPCTGILCNSCDVSYVRRFDPGGTPLSREFTLAIGRPCSSCQSDREDGIYSTAGPGFPAGTQKALPAFGSQPAIYENKKAGWWESFFGRHYTFTIENECIGF